jgi:hypothetical protein
MGDSSDPVLSMPIKSLLKRNKKTANLGVAVRRSTRIKKAKINSKLKASFGIVMGLVTRQNTLLSKKT